MTDAGVRLNRESFLAIRRAFKAVGELESESGTTTGSKILVKAWKEVGEFAAQRARDNADTPLERKMRGAIKGTGTASRGARLRITKTKKLEAAWVAFWGTDRRLGWFAHPRYRAYTARDQGLPPWVGAKWRAARRGEGPHAINEALADAEDEILAKVEQALQDALDEIDRATKKGT